MSEMTPNCVDETQALREMYAALNRNDIPAAIAIYDSEVESNEFIESQSGGTLHGRAELQALMTRMRGNWAEGTCEPVRYLFADDKIVVFVRVHVRLKDETAFREGDLADAYVFRNGKVIYRRVFADRRDALAWAGLDEAEAY